MRSISSPITEIGTFLLRTILAISILGLSALTGINSIRSNEILSLEEDDEEVGNPELEALIQKFDAEKTKEAFERIETIDGFGNIKSPETVEFLIPLFEVELNSGIIGAIVRALGKQGTQEAVQAIIEKGVPPLTIISEKDFLNVFEGVGEYSLKYAFSNPFDKEAQDWLVEKGLTTEVKSHPGAYDLILSAIVEFKHSGQSNLLKSELKTIISHENLAIILNLYRDKQLKGAKQIATKYLKTGNVKIKIAALEVLLSIKSKQPKRKYLKLLKHSDWRIQALAIDLLALNKDPSLIKKLSPLLRSPSDSVKIAVIRAFLNIESKNIIKILIKTLGTSEGRVKDDITDALARLTGVDLGPFTTQWESWWATNKKNADIRIRTMEEFHKIKEDQIKEDEKKKTATASYHGLRVISKNCIFIVDCSESMLEQYSPEEEEEEEEDGEGDDDDNDEEKEGEKDDEEKENNLKKNEVKTKMEVAKLELIKIILSLQDGTATNFVRFNSIIEYWRKALHVLDKDSRKEAAKFINSSTPQGLTNIYEALEFAFQDISIDTIFFLSDGLPTIGKYTNPDKIVAEIVKLNMLRKVKINTIGFGLEPKEADLLKNLAFQNYGVFIAR